MAGPLRGARERGESRHVRLPPARDALRARAYIHICICKGEGYDLLNNLHATRYSQKRNLTEVTFIEITQPSARCIPHNFRERGEEGGSDCRERE